MFAVSLKGRVYFLSAGFSLAFGAMFTKTFRIHRIFARRNKLIKTKVNRLLIIAHLIIAAPLNDWMTWCNSCWSIRS